MEIEIEVVNWEKFNARNDIKNPWWFKFDNHFFDDPKFADYGDSEKQLWILILTVASREQKKKFTLKYSYIEKNTHLEGCTIEGHNTIKTAIEKLESDQCIKVIAYRSVRVAYGSVRNTYGSVPREEKRREEKRISLPQNQKFDFEGIYLKYPRKIGKQKGMEKCKAKIKLQVEYEKLVKAVENYARYCRVNQTEEKYIKHFDSWMTVWKDWIIPDKSLYQQKQSVGRPLPPEASTFPKLLPTDPKLKANVQKLLSDISKKRGSQ